MKKILFVLAAMVVVGATLTGCKNKPTEAAATMPVDSSVVEKETNYFPAIDRYLVNEIGRHYAEAEHCVPLHIVVQVDERNSDDILLWGDFWVLNYNQEGDTLKCVSGGNHSGLLHIKQTADGYEVTGFDQTADGAGFVESAKRIFGKEYKHYQLIHSDEQGRERLRKDVLAAYAEKHGLKANYYQDYGWPAKPLR